MRTTVYYLHIQQMLLLFKGGHRQALNGQPKFICSALYDCLQKEPKDQPLASAAISSNRLSKHNQLRKPYRQEGAAEPLAPPLGASVKLLFDSHASTSRILLDLMKVLKHVQQSEVGSKYSKYLAADSKDGPNVARKGVHTSHAVEISPVYDHLYPLHPKYQSDGLGLGAVKHLRCP